MKNDLRNDHKEKALRDSIARDVEEKIKSDAIIAALGVGIIIQDTDYKIIFQNKVQNDIYGDRTGQYCYRAYEGRDSVCENCPVEMTFKDGKNHRAERKIVTDEGTNYYELISSPLKDTSGSIIAGIKLVKNITEQKRAEEALRQSEEKYRLLIDNIHDGVFIIQDAKIQFANKAFGSMTGYTNEEIVGKNIHDLLAPEDLEMVTDRYSRRQRGEKVPSEYEFNMLHRDGITRILVNMKVELMTYRGRIASMGTVMDITERKKAETALNASEKKYSTLVEKSNDGIVIIQDGILKFGNPMILGITGFNMNEIIEKPFIDFIFPSFKKMAIERYNKRMSGENVPNKYEIALLSKDGEKIPVEINASKIEYENREADMAIIRDIKERKKMEDKLRDGERFLESIFGSIQDGIGIIDSDMNIIRVNETAKNWYPHAMPFVGKKCYEAYHNRKERCDPCPAWQTIQTGESAYNIIPKNGPGGKKIGWLEIYSYPLKDRSSGEMKGVIEYVRDITERISAEEVIKKYGDQLEESNRMKELFIDIMHHDLLNPINTAYGFIEIMKENDTQNKVFLDTIKRNLTKAMELIENASRFSKLGTLENIEFEDMDLREVIKEDIENLEYLASMAEMKIENNITESLPVEANKIIEEVFANILSNAIKYASSGKRIIIKSEDAGEFWRIRIIDFGKGIKDEEKKLLFERFRRVEKKGVKGSGLGLAIAKKIMDLHNGRILIEDNPEGGAIFVVDIPKIQAKTDPS